jgi:hypothetical protein
VSLGQAIAGALPLLQGEAESMMTDTCTITRGGGTRTFNATTGTYSTSGGSTVYSGKCRIRTRSLGFLRERQAEAGEEQVVLWPYTVAVPVSVTDLAVLDELTVNTSTDPALADVVMRVRVVSLVTNATARKMDCEEVARG